ncbi:hypothetical protein CFC21_074779 [Triticum aestivum]|uniref:BHLH domain-containing protein n=2 Tax=Triticum aestivum TaxID=4565 RepID=A0A9R1HPB2_WHEAT|nr:hypothetical protein CFC21_074778 [Triticum aestivum]KAF7069111.1 hypothetical protein CFC21_074779 [Triticum aestivum]
MDESSIFLQWAMEALGQGQYAAVAGDAFSSSPFLEPHHSAALQSGTDMAAHRYGATDDSRSSGNSGAALAKENNGWSSNCSTNYPAVSPNFTSGSVAAPSHGVPEPAHRSPPSRKSSPSNNGTASTGQKHVMAERKRREKLNRHFIELSTVIPGLKKMDKTTILSDAVRYVKEQHEKLKALQDRDDRTIESVVLVKRPCISNVDDGRPSPPPSAVAQTSPTPAIKTSLPEIDARILERNVMGEDPLRGRQGGPCHVARRGRGAPSYHHTRQCHVLPGLHSHHKSHGKGGRRLQHHSGGHCVQARPCIETVSPYRQNNNIKDQMKIKMLIKNEEVANVT